MDLTKPFSVIPLDELYLTLDELQYDLSMSEDEFEIYEIEEDIEHIISLINCHPEGGILL